MELVQAARRLLSRGASQRRRRQQGRQRPRCALLQLPVELLVLISSRLPVHSQVLLSQTCRSLQAVLGNVRGAAAHLPCRQHLIYLSSLARDLAEWWLCDQCLTLHRVVELDTPARPWFASCPRGWLQLQRRGAGYGFDSFQLDYRHVQLTLKYARLRLGGDSKWRHRRYLARLLAPHRTGFSPEPFEPSVLAARYSAFPKVVAGRYLLLSIWRYDGDREPVSRKAMGVMFMCRHQGLTSQGSSELPAWRRPPHPNFALHNAVNAAFEAEDVEVLGCCTICPTDFSVQASPRRATLRAWQDLGPECSPLALAWRVHVAKGCWGVGHEPGSIRRLYEASQ